jgi:hypothetical protein
VLGSARTQDCTAISDVLSDGPDPDADPVGYAQAQVLQLRGLHLYEVPVRKLVSSLASAYQAESSAPGGTPSSAVKAQVAKAEAAMNDVCPQAAP